MAASNKEATSAKSPETAPEPDRTRESYAALGIGLVVLLIGVPIWWKTTEIYRCQLPYAEIDELATLPLELTIRVDVAICLVAEDQRLSLGSRLLHLLTDSLNSKDTEDSGLKLRYQIDVRACSSAEQQALQSTTSSLNDFSARLDAVLASDKGRSQHHGNLTVYIIPSDLLASLPVSKYLNSNNVLITRGRLSIIPADHLEAVRDGETVERLVHMIRNVVVDERSVIESFLTHQHGAVPLQADKKRMRSLKLSSVYDITFSLINSQPALISPQWDINAAVSKYLGHFQTSLKEFVTFDIKSQFLHHIGLGVIPKRDDKIDCTYLSLDQLPHIINPIEAHLGSYVSNNPSVNFIVYIPTQQQTPLRIYEQSGKPSKANALFSPRWGGVYFYNVDDVTVTTALANHSTSLPLALSVDMKRVMEVFAAQLRVLLGFHNKVHKEGIDLQSAASHIITDWELDAWLRERCVENLATTAATLRSLSELLGKIGNLVIHDDIGKQVESAVRLMRETRGHLVNAELREAFLTSHAALIASEKAFFDPSLLELLYFPEDQKFAIYIPLFLPVGLPIVLSCVQAVRWLVKRYKLQASTGDQSTKTKSN